VSGERGALVRELRAVLEDFARDGLDYLPRAAAPEAEPPARPTPARPTLDAAGELAELRAELGDCRRCGLCEQRNKIVFGEGNPEAPVVFVGEGPGAEEDRSGRPFVGRAGALLTRMIEALEWTRDDVYICNIVKCRPPRNRDPKPDEIATCRPFLDRQLQIIQPRVIVSLGRPATSTLLGRNVAITKLRGSWQEWNGVPLMPTYHPAYVLRQYNRETRQAVWDDLRAVKERATAAPHATR
jgi:DNA polymerase